MALPFSLKPIISRWAVAIIFIIALVGFADASYLAIVHFQGTTPPCSLVEGCEVVTTSRYATIGPVPIALLGSLFYFSILVTVVAYWDSKKRFFAAVLPLLGFSGFLVSLVLVSLQLFVIKAICLYCMGSATSSTLIFIFSLFLLRFDSFSPGNNQISD